MDSMNSMNIIKTLGTGMFGTTYLVKDNDNNNYALKIQHILPSDRFESYKRALWRELDLYNYINNLERCVF
jgi:serine/threonine protein kinase